MHTLEQLAQLTQSTYSGDKHTEIDSVASISDASTRQISFISNTKYLNQLEGTSASAVILNAKLAETYQGNALINDDPYLTFAKVLYLLHKTDQTTRSVHKSANIDSTANVDESATIGANVVIEAGVTIASQVTIGAGSYIGQNSSINSGTHIYPNVSIYNDTNIGKNTIIHSGAVIGADGFGFAPTPDKEWYKILQIGNVVIGNNVEIGANSTIDRAALGSTEIRNGVKLDSQLHIGHNAIIDEHTVMAASTVVGGSTHIGKRCQIGGATAIAGHITIADDVMITGKSMVTNTIKSAGVYSSGIPIDANKQWRKNTARFKKLDELARKVSQIEKNTANPNNNNS